MNLKKLFAAVMVGILGFTGIAMGETKDGNIDELRRMFDQHDFKYSMTKSGNISAIFKIDEKRSQLIIINAKPAEYRGIAVREIWSLGYRGKLNFGMTRDMLAQNGRLKIGAWETSSEYDIAAFTAKVPLDLSWDEIRSCMIFVSEVADEFENKYVGSDDL